MRFTRTDTRDYPRNSRWPAVQHTRLPVIEPDGDDTSRDTDELGYTSHDSEEIITRIQMRLRVWGLTLILKPSA